MSYWKQKHHDARCVVLRVPVLGGSDYLRTTLRSAWDLLRYACSPRAVSGDQYIPACLAESVQCWTHPGATRGFYNFLAWFWDLCHSTHGYLPERTSRLRDLRGIYYKAEQSVSPKCAQSALPGQCSTSLQQTAITAGRLCWASQTIRS